MSDAAPAPPAPPRPPPDALPHWSRLVSHTRVAGKSLNGSYRASNGNNGEFRLQSK